MRPVLGIAVAGSAVASLLAGCGNSESETACSVDELTIAVDDIVSESSRAVAEMNDVRCSGGWAVVTATSTGVDAEIVVETFVFRRDDDTWVVEPPERACDATSDVEALPEELRSGICDDAPASS